ncbi:hypothetical protein KIPB_004209 [Kipferlia bialata]|uniref:Uncharacterized protein n=1 Tax=Kipferlia bialata TaxID=797122 RepID=A0A391NVL4_9EUKA|nr:hypothetical protein KIPB_004209 [Kipferlia bialata]|eukprot:g4209.t1
MSLNQVVVVAASYHQASVLEEHLKATPGDQLSALTKLKLVAFGLGNSQTADRKWVYKVKGSVRKWVYHGTIPLVGVLVQMPCLLEVDFSRRYVDGNVYSLGRAESLLTKALYEHPTLAKIDLRGQCYCPPVRGTKFFQAVSQRRCPTVVICGRIMLGRPESLLPALSDVMASYERNKNDPLGKNGPGFGLELCPSLNGDSSLEVMLRGMRDFDMIRKVTLCTEPFRSRIWDREVAIRVNTVKHSDIAALASILPGLSDLTWLDLSNLGIGDNGAALLAKGLPKSLQSARSCFARRLDLSHNSIGAEGTIALISRLPDTITHINLEGNPIGPRGAAAIGSTLKELPKLRELRIGSCKIGLLGCAALAECLARRSDADCSKVIVYAAKNGFDARLLKLSRISKATTHLEKRQACDNIMASMPETVRAQLKTPNWWMSPEMRAEAERGREREREGDINTPGAAMDHPPAKRDREGEREREAEGGPAAKCI